MLTPRERVKTALAHREPDRVPLGYYFTPEAEAATMKYLGVDSREAFLRRLGVDIRYVFPDYIGPKEFCGAFGILDGGKDIWGVDYGKTSYGIGDYYEIVNYPLKDIDTVEELEKYPWPDPEWFDFKSVKRQIDEYEKEDEYCIAMTFCGSVFEYSWYMRGMDRFMMDLVLSPDYARKIMDKMSEFWIGLTTGCMEACGNRIDIARCGDDMGGQEAMLTSPEVWRKMIKPYFKKYFQTYHKYGAYTWYHSDGSIAPIIGELAEIGLDILNPLQFSARGFPGRKELKEKYGDVLSFNGGIDVQTVLPFRTVEEIREETIDLIQTLGRGGGYILESSHHVQPDTRPENVMAMYDTALNFSY